MCGIHASISTRSFLAPSSHLKQLLCNRGPDYVGEAVAEINKHGTPYYLSFTSTVLALRGGNVTPQPFVDPNTGSVFCWNGEAWKIGSEPVLGNDGQAVFDALLKAASAQSNASADISEVLDVLKSISGPFAFIFLDRKLEQIFFGRDRLGRRSLLYNTDVDNMEFSSTADPSRGIWNEVDADSIHVLSRSQDAPTNRSKLPDDILQSSSILPIRKYDWDATKALSMSSLGVFNRNIPVTEQMLTYGAKSVNSLHHHLCESLKLRILNIPVPPGSGNAYKTRVAILFSGGLDCTVLARMAHDLLPSEYQFDLLNVAFENPRVIQAANNPPKSKGKVNRSSQVTNIEEVQRSLPNREDVVDNSPFEGCPDRETGRKAFQELNRVCPTRVWRFVAIRQFQFRTVCFRRRE